MAPKSKRKAKRKRTEAQDVRAVAIEGLVAGHEHASDMGVYRHAGREVNGRGVWTSVGLHVAYLFYSEMGSWCVSDSETDMAAGEHQGSLMVESDAETPHAITESWSVHDTMSKAQTSASWRSRGAALSARSRLRLPRASASLGHSPACGRGPALPALVLTSRHDSETWSADAPGVRVRLASDAEVEATVQSVKRVQRAALAAAQRARILVVGGVPAGEEYDDSMGS